MHCLLSFTFVTLLIHWFLSLTFLFVLDLHMKYTVEVVPLHTYIVWVCYRVIAASCAGSVGCVFVHLYSIVDDPECPSL